MASDLNIVDSGHSFPRVTLVPATPSGYIHFAIEVDRRPPFLWASRRKRAILEDCRRFSANMAEHPDVVRATVFRAALIPPGRGRFLKRRAGRVDIARFDVAVLIETRDLDAAQRILRDESAQRFEAGLRASANRVHTITAVNVKRIGPVEHRREGVFLFNYFFADETDRNLAVWEYTAGWFQQQTGLDSSTILLPAPGASSQYNVINHCRWDRWRDILPSLLFKHSFRSYVLANFEANNVAAMPILYRRNHSWEGQQSQAQRMTGFRAGAS